MTAELFEKLGRIQGDIGALLRGQDAMSDRLSRHFEDDRALAERIGEIEIELARFAGAEATGARRAAGIASIIGGAVAIVSSIFARSIWGQH